MLRFLRNAKAVLAGVFSRPFATTTVTLERSPMTFSEGYDSVEDMVRGTLGDKAAEDFIAYVAAHPTFEHKGYTATPEWANGDRAFHGRVDGIRHIVHFTGDTIAEARQAFADSVDDYMEFCAERGVEPNKPKEAS